MSLFNDDRRYGTDKERREWKQELDYEYRRQEARDREQEESKERDRDDC